MVWLRHELHIMLRIDFLLIYVIIKQEVGI